jgi:methylated-DNA-[protein]-cysteine S-methyltransferase
MNRGDPLERRLSGAGTGLDDESAAAAGRFAERAASEGAARIAYGTVDTPLGSASIAATPRGVLSVRLPTEELDSFLARLAERVSPRIVEAPATLDRPRRELEEYFQGRRETFDLPLDWQLVPGGFYRKVLRATSRLPFGITLTYGEIAERAGNRRAHRAAGSALGANPIPIVVPCHRIIRSGGDPGNYGGGPELKKWLLELEGSLGDDPAA